MTLNPSQQMVLQAFMSNGILNATDMFKVLKQCCEHYNVNIEDKKQVLLTYVRQINDAVAVFGMQIKKVTDETDGSSHYCLVNTTESSITLLASTYTENELEFFKKLVELIVLSDNGNIGSIEAVNISDSLTKKMSKSDADHLIDRFIEDKWIGKLRNGHVYLGTRSVLELEQYLLDMYEDHAVRCNMCKKLCTQGETCDSCGIKLHKHCALKYFKEGTVTKCPVCQNPWHRPITNGTHAGQPMEVEAGPSQPSTSQRKRKANQT